MKQILLLLSCICLTFFCGYAQNTSTSSPLIFIYDASGSMWGALEGKTKMQIAGRVLTQTLDQLPGDQPIGLFAYGHRREKDCTDVEWLVPMTNQDKNLLRETIGNIKPLGRTPLARSAGQVIDQLRADQQKATIILITDGIESCDGDLCEVVRLAKAEGVDFKMHIVGFGLKDDETTALRCAAEAGGGEYYEASNTGSLAAGLQEATSIRVDETTVAATEPAKPNLSVFATKNGEAIDSWVLASLIGSDDRPATLRTYADTSTLSLPAGKYQLSFRPLEGSDVRSKTLEVVEVFADSLVHRSVSFDAGKIAIYATKNGEGSDAVYEIHPQEAGAKKTGGRTYGKRKETELDPGLYNIEIKVLNVSGTAITYTMEDVVVRGTETTEIIHDFTSGQLIVLLTNNGEPWDGTYQVTDQANGTGIAGGRTYAKPDEKEINPGVYRLKLLALQISGEGREHIIEHVEVKVNETTEVAHDFVSGTVKIGVVSGTTLVDAVVVLKNVDGSRGASGRTYTTDTSNPWTSIMVPGTYEVNVKGLADFKGQEETFTITVVAGQTIERTVRF